MDSVTAEGDQNLFQTLQASLEAHYTLERELGRGGMATVYLATDVRHGRKVAVKVLHPELAAVLGATRFLAEIRTTAALQHPHVLPLFDSGEVAGHLYYVMPFVEGETLRARLIRERQLPVSEAVRVATEVASALDYAHRRGVIHRDIKPENILLGDDGQALVADFGIALAVTHAGGERMTQSGLSLGTPQYMAPEQAAAERAVDARADVYALGAITYEMLTGEPPFTGSSAQVVIAKLMTEEPKSLTSMRRTVPIQIEAAVRTALEKLPADRFPTAGAFATALAVPSAARDSVTTRIAAHGARGWSLSSPHALLFAVVLLAAGVAVGLAIGRAGVAPARATSARGPVRFIIKPDSGLLGSRSGWHGAPAISPDGQTIVYAATEPRGAQLFARRVDEVAARPIPGTEGGDWPFFSPDGEWVGFRSSNGRSIRKVRLDGGTPVVVTELPASSDDFFGGTWSNDDTIIYTTFFDGALYRVPASGGSPTRIAVVDTAKRLVHPQLLPGGKAVLVTSSTDWRVGRIGVLDLATGVVRRFGPGAGARYLDGHIIFAGPSGALYRQPFDLDRLEPTGTAEEIAGGVDVYYAGLSPFDVSATGSLVYHLGRGGWKLSVIDRTGREEQVLPGLFPWSPRFSPDGRRIAYSAVTPGQEGGDMWSSEVWHTDILITDLATNTIQRLTNDGNDNNEPVWSPDSRTMVFDAGLLGTKDLFVRALDGDSTRLLTRRPGNQFTSDWTPDGSTVVFSDQSPGIWLQPLTGGNAHPYLATNVTNETRARVSPDGKWLAYASNETGRSEVYIQSFPTPAVKVLISSGGGGLPAWRRDGRELFYWRGDQLFAASLEVSGPGKPPVVRSRTPLFRINNVSSGGYDVSPDGTRFVVVTGGPRTDQLVVALDALGAARRSQR